MVPVIKYINLFFLLRVWPSKPKWASFNNDIQLTVITNSAVLHAGVWGIFKVMHQRPDMNIRSPAVNSTREVSKQMGHTDTLLFVSCSSNNAVQPFLNQSTIRRRGFESEVRLVWNTAIKMHVGLRLSVLIWVCVPACGGAPSPINLPPPDVLTERGLRAGADIHRSVHVTSETLDLQAAAPNG